MRLLVLTTSYPRHPGDVVGTFVAGPVEQLRRRGLDVHVVSPQDFAHYGIAYGHGIVGNLRRRPWLVLLVPLMLWNFRRAARRHVDEADVIHAHWWPAAAVALGLGKPVVAQLWGSDVALAHRIPRLARAVLRRVDAVVCPSRALADDARALGAADPIVIAPGVDLPPADELDAAAEAEPAELLYVGRLSPEKGVLELAEAATGLPLVIAGDGPLRAELPEALGFVAHDELGPYYRRAAAVVCPSHREGFGMACAEAMAHGRPVVASAVGGLLDLVVDGETGLLVPPGDIAALRAALERILADREARVRMGRAARERIAREFSWDASIERTLALYAKLTSA